MGRPKKSTPLKVLHGVRGSENTVPFVSAEVGPPTWLVSQTALTEWNRVAEKLKQEGRLSLVDQAALAIYCDSLTTYVRASVTVQSKGFTIVGGHGTERESPWCKIMHDAYVRFMRLATEFGLTTAAREKLSPPAAPKDTKREKFFGS